MSVTRPTLIFLPRRRGRRCAAGAAAARTPLSSLPHGGDAEHAGDADQGDGDRPTSCGALRLLLEIHARGTERADPPSGAVYIGRRRRRSVALSSTLRRPRSRLDRGAGDAASVLVAQPKRSRGDLVLAADRRAEVRRVVRAEGDPDARRAQGRERVLLEAVDRRRGRRCASGSTSRTSPRSASSATSAGSSIARTPWPIRVDAAGRARARTLRPRPTRRRGRCSPGRPSCAIANALGERRRAGSRPRRRPCRSRRRRGAAAPAAWRATSSQRRSTPKLRTHVSDDPRLDAVVARARRRCPAAIAAKCSSSDSPTSGRVVGRGDQLDVDRALRGAGRRGTRR